MNRPVCIGKKLKLDLFPLSVTFNISDNFESRLLFYFITFTFNENSNYWRKSLQQGKTLLGDVNKQYR